MTKDQRKGLVSMEALGKRGIFYVGGELKGEEGKHHMEGQMFVENYVPKTVKHDYPLIFLHGAGQTNVGWMVTPDGRMGWADWFVQQGWEVYLCEQPCRGRSAYHFDPANPLMSHSTEIIERRYTSNDDFWVQSHLHTQWPNIGTEDEKATLRSFIQSQVEYLPSNRKSQELTLACMGELLEITGPAILVTHSQSGPFGWEILDSYPDKIKGVVAAEPAGPVFGRDPKADHASNYGITDLPLEFDPPVSSPADFEVQTYPAPAEGMDDGLLMKEGYERRLVNFKDAKILVMTTEASYHVMFDWQLSEFLKQAGVDHDFVYLKDVGITGNGHMLMLEKNNLEIAAFINSWLEKNNF